MRHRGRVIRFFDKGFGFIEPDVEPASGNAVTYALARTATGAARQSKTPTNVRFPGKMGH
jgi:hypothetical protein